MVSKTAAPASATAAELVRLPPLVSSAGKINQVGGWWGSLETLILELRNDLICALKRLGGLMGNLIEGVAALFNGRWSWHWVGRMEGSCLNVLCDKKEDNLSNDDICIFTLN
jgi:hypothetical protein